MSVQTLNAHSIPSIDIHAVSPATEMVYIGRAVLVNDAGVCSSAVEVLIPRVLVKGSQRCHFGGLDHGLFHALLQE